MRMHLGMRALTEPRTKTKTKKVSARLGAGDRIFYMSSRGRSYSAGRVQEGGKRRVRSCTSSHFTAMLLYLLYLIMYMHLYLDGCIFVLCACVCVSSSIPGRCKCHDHNFCPVGKKPV